jgi:small conductance mechanosensitive channel
MDLTVVRFYLRNLIYVGLMAVVIIAALKAAGIQTTSLTTLLATAGVAISLAMKDDLAIFDAIVLLVLIDWFLPLTLPPTFAA